MGWVDPLKPESVKDAKSLIAYAKQETGIPGPMSKQMPALAVAIRDFFDGYPNADWNSLVKVVEWAKKNKVRYATTVTLVTKGYRQAWSAGFLPELDPNWFDNEKLMEARDAAIRVETDTKWCDDLYYVRDTYLIEKLQEWLTYRTNSGSLVPDEVKGYFA